VDEQVGPLRMSPFHQDLNRLHWPNTVTEIKYSSLNSTARDHGRSQAPRKHQVAARVTSFGTVKGSVVVAVGGLVLVCGAVALVGLVGSLGDEQQ
jgi:hypothetical protein